MNKILIFSIHQIGIERSSGPILIVIKGWKTLRDIDHKSKLCELCTLPNNTYLIGKILEIKKKKKSSKLKNRLLSIKGD